MNIYKNNIRAFTLLELLIAVAIIGIMTTLVMVSLGDGRTQKELAVNAQEFIGVVREAQNYALTGRQTATGTLCAFQVSLFGASGYRLYSGYIGGGSLCTSFTLEGSYTLQNGVSFSALPVISFTVPHATLPVNREVILTKNSVFHTVCIYVDGQIKDFAGNGGC